jgi:hypothetical protein
MGDCLCLESPPSHSNLACPQLSHVDDMCDGHLTVSLSSHKSGVMKGDKLTQQQTFCM